MIKRQLYNIYIHESYNKYLHVQILDINYKNL